MTRIRRNVWDLVADENDRTLYWYGRALTAMRERSILDYRSLRFQAAIHEYDRDRDPFAVAGEELPSSADQETFWTQCQHSSWFFLPWHRMYLYVFEEIVAAEVKALGGPDDWALPYWNYSKNTAERLLPTPFRDPTLADGSENPLYVEERAEECNRGEEFADDEDVAVDCLRVPSYAAPLADDRLRFGGPMTANEHQGEQNGELENVPHGTMHLAVGGAGGWMSASFTTAGLDPVFYLHHANLDRLWEVWKLRNPEHHDPQLPLWKSGVRFPFRGVDGELTEITCAEVEDPADLGYTYDDISDPIREGLAGFGKPPSGVAELIGATHIPIDLGQDTTHVAVPTPLSPLDDDRLDDEPEPSLHLFLRVEHLTSDHLSPPYDVFVGVAPEDDPRDHPERRVGRMSMFGIVESSRRGSSHAGSGLTYSFDITDLVTGLRGEPGWLAESLPVAFVAARPWEDTAVRVGRLGVYAK